MEDITRRTLVGTGLVALASSALVGQALGEGAVELTADPLEKLYGLWAADKPYDAAKEGLMPFFALLPNSMGIYPELERPNAFTWSASQQLLMISTGCKLYRYRMKDDDTLILKLLAGGLYGTENYTDGVKVEFDRRTTEYTYSRRNN